MTGEKPEVHEALAVYAVETTETERVPEGYRQTEVGMIPAYWEVVPLSELLDFRNGVNADKSAYGEGTPFINVLEVITNTHLSDSDIPGRITLPRLLLNSYVVQKGDILFNRTSETQDEVGLASVYLGDDTVVFGGFVIRGRKRQAAIDDVFSGYAFRSPIIRSQIVSKGQGAVRANIGQQELSKVAIALPPLYEQRAIAAALSDVDALISALDELISKKRAVKTAAMQQLLTGKQRLPGFEKEKGYKQTELGMIPQDWETKKLEEVSSIATGSTPPTHVDKYYGDEFLFVSPGDLGKEKYIHQTEKKLSKAGFCVSRRFPAGSILFTCIGATIGKCGIATMDLTSNQQINAVFAKGSTLNEYVYYSLRHAVPRIKSLAGEQAVPIINKDQFSKTELLIPPVEEQTAIAAVLSDMDAEIGALESRREKTRQVKRGMMQELLTGRTRLI